MMNAAGAAASVANVANKASTFANQTVETARAEVLKEPLGFIKIVQILLAIITFAVAVNGGDTINFKVNCNPTTSTEVSATYNYPYDLANTKWNPYPFCGAIGANERSTIAQSSGTIVSSAGFFVFTGVISFLYALAFIIIYVFFKHKYDNVLFFSTVDFGLTCLIALFWFIASVAWAKAIDDIKSQVTVYGETKKLIEIFPTSCPKAGVLACIASTSNPTFASLIISCIFGFGNIILWGGNIWFVLKETAWYKAKNQQQAASQYTVNSNDRI